LPIIQWKVSLEDTVVNSDGWTSYNALVDIWAMKHYRVHHSKNEFARGKQHINGMESFWSYAKRRMAKSNGIRKEYFLLHLKESEFRYNCMRTWTEMKKTLIKILRKFTNQLL
jgi:transposase